MDQIVSQCSYHQNVPELLGMVGKFKVQWGKNSYNNFVEVYENHNIEYLYYDNYDAKDCSSSDSDLADYDENECGIRTNNVLIRF